MPVESLTVCLLKKLELETFFRPSGLFEILGAICQEGNQAEKTQLLRQDDYMAICHKLQHALTRLLSYNVANENLAAAAIRWPQLFQGATVRFLPSIDPKPHAFDNFRMLGTKAMLQDLGFDNEFIKDATPLWPRLSYRRNGCIEDIRNQRKVHAEIQLWSHIKHDTFIPFRLRKPRTDNSSPMRRIIGVSKLTCRLCHWYFKGLGPDLVAIRSSSLNVYHRWALPTSLPSEDITEGFCSRLHSELESVLRGEEVKRTETDTDSQPNSARPHAFPEGSSDGSSDSNSSGVWSGGECGTLSVESDSEVEKVEM